MQGVTLLYGPRHTHPPETTWCPQGSRGQQVARQLHQPGWGRVGGVSCVLSKRGSTSCMPQVCGSQTPTDPADDARPRRLPPTTPALRQAAGAHAR